MDLSPKGFSLVELMLVVVIIGIVTSIAMPNYFAMQARAREAEVIALGHTVQLAVEDRAARHDGIYSDQAADIVPLLPGSGLLKNPFTGELTEPQCGAVASTAGQVGVQLVTTGGRVTGYVISGFGHREEVLRYLAGS